jgi:hypothetical protein
LPDNQVAPAGATARRRSVTDTILTIILVIASFTLAVTLFTASVLWVVDNSPDSFAFALGAYGPFVIALAGLVLAVIAFIRKRTAFIYPLTAIVLSPGVWWIASILVNR